MSDTFVVVQSLSCVRLFVTPWTAAYQGFSVLHYLPEFASIHVHQVRDVIQPSHALSLPSPLVPNHSQQQGLFQSSNSSHQVARLIIRVSASASVLPMNIQG